MRCIIFPTICYLIGRTFCFIPTLSSSHNKRTVTTPALNDLKLFAQYSAATYCPTNYINTTWNHLHCASEICPLLNNTDIQVAYAFANATVKKTSGLIFLDHVRNLTVVAFEGTTNSENWVTDLHWWLDDYGEDEGGCDGC